MQERGSWLQGTARRTTHPHGPAPGTCIADSHVMQSLPPFPRRPRAVSLRLGSVQEDAGLRCPLSPGGSFAFPRTGELGPSPAAHRVCAAAQCGWGPSGQPSQASSGAAGGQLQSRCDGSHIRNVFGETRSRGATPRTERRRTGRSRS